MRSIAELVALQAERGLSDVHVVELDEHGFVMAHTNQERAHKERTPLLLCALHTWLVNQDPEDLPAPPGLYIVTPHVPDAYSEPYRAAPWDLEPLKLK